MARRRTYPNHFARALVVFDDHSELNEEFVIPEDLTALSDEELTALHEQAVANFDQIYGDGQGLTDADLQALTDLTSGIEAISGELGTRREAAEARSREAAELAARAHPEEPPAPEGEADPEDEEQQPETDGDPTPVIEGTVVEGTEPEAIAAAATRRSEVRINLSNIRSRQVAPSLRPAHEAQGIRDVMLAAGEGSGFASGQGVDFLEAGQIVDRRLAGFNEAMYEQASARGENLRQQFGVVTIRKPIPENLRVVSNDLTHVEDVIRRATDESNLPGGSLVASGGWCAPSEILYGNLLELESRDGLISVPEIGVSRGGINFTTGVDFWDIWNGTGFDYTEQNDIDAHYSAGAATNEVQTVATTGTPTGGTFRLAFNGAPTANIAYNASAATVLAAIRGVVGYDQASGATGGPLPTGVAVTFAGTLSGVDVPAMTLYTNALTGGSSPTVTVTETTKGATAANADGDKPCYKVTCPSFTDVRLGTAGLCITAGLLQQRGYPEVISRTVRGALVAHDHKMSARVINKMVAGSTAVIMNMDQVGTFAPMLNAIEKQVEHYRYVHRAARRTTLEAVFPYWILGAIRADLSLRAGVQPTDITDAQIRGWFVTRGVNPQFVYDWQALTGAAGTFLNYPSVVQFLLYAAGTWVKGTSDVITLDTVYDTQLVKQNDFTALFTEEGYLVAKMAVDSRVVSVPVCVSGGTGAGVRLDCVGVPTS